MIQLPARHGPDLTRADGDPAGLSSIQTIGDLFERQVRRTPRAAAVTFSERDHSYAELDCAATAIARSVAARISGPAPLVGICVNRSFEMIACLIGIMKAGAAYLPLDPGLPEARLHQIVAEANPVLVVAPAELASRLEAAEVPLLRLDEVAWSAQEPGTGGPAKSGLGAQSLAYVLYTSGSTGPPKGVEVTHGSVLNLLAACQREPGMDERDVALALARMSFDVSVLEIFLPLSCGARVVVLPESATRDPYALAREIERHRATVMQAPPALWQSLVDTGWKGSGRLRAWTGAEALPRLLADRLLPLCQELWNCYGPTETTVLSTCHRVRAGDGDVPIGGPIAETTVAVLDEALRPVLDGHEGELCIGGAGVARGYRGRPELTAERFLVPPGGDALVYRTGDLVRVGANGSLFFIGRIDAQVKVRGFRIEPGEIEQILTSHAAVATCVVRAWPDAIGHNALFAYVVRRPDEEASEVELKAYLRARLPDYMVPQQIVFLPQLPVTPNAKVDRAALPAPFDMVAAHGKPATVEHVMTATENSLAAIWRSLLGPRALGPSDDFFELGGYSLLTVQLLLYVEDAFGRSLSTAELLSHSSLSRMAALIDGVSGDVTSRRVIPIRPEGRGAPLYWLDAGPLLRPALRAIGGDVPVLGLNLAPEDERQLLATGFDIAQLASVIVAILRELQSDQPFHLGGWCRWGTVAYEVARQLQKTGHSAPHVVLLDTDLPVRQLGLRKAAGRFRHWAAGAMSTMSSERDAAPASENSFSERVGWLSATYNAEPYKGDVTLIQPAIRKRAQQAVKRWARKIQGALTVRTVAGDHVSMVHNHSLEAAMRATLLLDTDENTCNVHHAVG